MVRLILGLAPPASCARNDRRVAAATRDTQVLPTYELTTQLMDDFATTR